MHIMAITESGVGASANLGRVGTESSEPSHVEGQFQEETERALMDVYGFPGRRKMRLGEQLNRAQILDVGYAGMHDQPGALTALNVSPQNGSLALAEGTGAETGADVAARGFGYAMHARQTQHAKTIAAAVGLVRQSADKIPKAIRLAQKHRAEQEPTTGTVTGVQLFDNKVIVDGRRPVFIYDLQTADCIWVNRGGKAGTYAHTLNVGQHIIVMSTGRNSDDELQSLKVRTAIENVLAEPGSGRALNAQAMAEALHEELANNNSRGALLVGHINLRPWQDWRPFWKKMADYTVRIPSTAVYGLAAFAVEKKRRQLYETRTTAGRLGRAAAIVGDLALDVGFLAFAYTMVRAGMGAAEEAHSLINTGPDLSTSGLHAFPGTDIPSIVDHQPPPHVVDPYTESRVAAGHDPISHNRPSTVWNWSQDALQHYGKEEGLPQSAIDKLTHDDDTVQKVNQAFYHDHNANNQRVADDPRHWLDAGGRYSQVDQGQAAHEIVLDTKHELGLDTPPPAVVEPVAPPPSDPGPAVVAPLPPSAPKNTIDSIPQALAENWAPIAAASGTGLLAFGAAARHRRKQRRRREALVESIKRGRMIGTHNEARRQKFQRLLASSRMPIRQPGARPIAPKSMLEDDDASGTALPPVAEELQVPHQVPRHRKDNGFPHRFDDNVT